MPKVSELMSSNIVNALRNVETWGTRINVKSYGAKGDGVTDDSKSIQEAVAAWRKVGSMGAQVPAAGETALYFPSGTYYCATPVNIETNGTGKTIVGDGMSSNLVGIQIKIQDYRCMVRDLMLSGESDYGISIDGTVNGLRYGLISNVHIRDKTDGVIVQVNNAHVDIVNLICEKCENGLRVESTMGLQLTNAHFVNNAAHGIILNAGGEFKLNNVTAIDNDGYGVWIKGTSATNNLENYFHELTATLNGSDDFNESYEISSISDAGGGNVTVTITGPHTLIPGMQGVKINGTTSYDGTYTISNVTATSFDITATFAGSETGTVIRPGWDLYIEAETLDDVNDLFFVGGNINFTYIKNGYNITFTNTRLKQQVHLDTAVNRIFHVGNARGRQAATYRDIPFSGLATGWGRIIYSDSSNSSSPGTGKVSIIAPDSASGVGADNLPVRLNRIDVTETGISMEAMGQTLAIDANGVRGSVTYTGRQSIPDDGVISFTPVNARGAIRFGMENQFAAYRGWAAYRADTVGEAQLIAGGTNVAATSGPLNGTTGSDGYVTVSAHTDGKIYIENRSGITGAFSWEITR